MDPFTGERKDKRKEKPTRTTTNLKNNRKKKNYNQPDLYGIHHQIRSDRQRIKSGHTAQRLKCKQKKKKKGTSYNNITKPSHPERVLYRITLIIIPTPSEGYGFDKRKDTSHISLPGPFTQITDLTYDGKA